MTSRPVNTRPRWRRVGPTCDTIQRSPLGQFPSFRPTASRQIAPAFAVGGNPRQGIGDRFAVDDEYPLVAIPDFRKVTLRHDKTAVMLGHGFEDDAQVVIALGDPEDRGAAHAVERLQDDLAMLA